MDINATATIRLVEALRSHSPDTRFYFAATSEMFGGMTSPDKADENWPLASRSPYASAKIAAFTTCRVARQRGMFIVSGIGFNHESARRGLNFVTRKIGVGVRNFKKNGQQVLLGNLDARRDWHHASDTVAGAHLALQHNVPDDYVFASGQARSVRQFAHAVCAYLNVDFDDAIGHTEVEMRPWDVDYLCGDPSKAERELGWSRCTSFDALVKDVCRVSE
jgi:GDPmannose 4,6-dehydratase